MKILSLNIWGGRAGAEKVQDFVARYKDTVDVFCFQEVWADTHEHLEGVLAGGTPLCNGAEMAYAKQQLGGILSDYRECWHPHYGDHYGLLTLSHEKHAVLHDGEVFVHREKGYMPLDDIGKHARNIQHITFETPKGHLTVINFHGLWNGQGKGDSPDRIAQTDAIIAFLKTLSNPYVLCGDFNLNPDTESLQKFEAFGLRNLIKEYDITSTRTSHYTKPGKYADYCFVSDGVEVIDFRVLPDEVSDHSPLLLEINF